MLSYDSLWYISDCSCIYQIFIIPTTFYDAFGKYKFHWPEIPGMVRKKSPNWKFFQYIVGWLRPCRTRREMFRQVWPRSIKLFERGDLHIPKLIATPLTFPMPESEISLNGIRKFTEMAFLLWFPNFESGVGTDSEGVSSSFRVQFLKMLLIYSLFTLPYEVSVNTLNCLYLHVLLNSSETDSQFSLGYGSVMDGSFEAISLICLLPCNA